MTEISAELVERMAAFVRRMADPDGERCGSTAEARAIVAELPAPVDPDVEQAKAIAFASGYGRCSDGNSIVLMLVKGIKRGRELAALSLDAESGK